MTVSELIDKLKDCAPGAEVRRRDGAEWTEELITDVDSNGVRVLLE